MKKFKRRDVERILVEITGVDSNVSTLMLDNLLNTWCSTFENERSEEDFKAYRWLSHPLRALVLDTEQKGLTQG